MTETVPRNAIVVAGIGSGLCGLLMALTQGHPVAALLPGAALAAGLLLWFAPRWIITSGLFFLLLVLDNPRERPHMGVWKTPLYHAGSWFYDTLQKKGFGPIKLFGIEVIIIVLGLVFFLQWLGQPPPPPEQEQARAPREFRIACFIAAAAIIFWELWGIARGGSLSRSLLQFRPMLFCAFMPLLYTTAIRERRHLRWGLIAVVVAALVRGSMAILFWYKIIRTGIRGELGAGTGAWATMHSDTLLFCTAFCIVAFAAIHRRPRGLAVLAPFAVPWLAFAIYVNNRRLAYVCIAVAFLIFFFVCDRWLKKRLYLATVVALPLFVAYVGAGWNSGAGWAAPAQSVKSLFSQDDSSSESRDVENYNLIYTASLTPIMGTGFGHEYKEKIRAVDLSNIFEVFRYLPHNNVLWLLGAAGVIGFTLFFGFVVTGMFMALRLYLFVPDDSTIRVLALGTVASLTAYVMQGYGDMGLQSWHGSVLISQMMGMTAIAYSLNKEKVQ